MVAKYRIPGLQVPASAEGEQRAFYEALKERLELIGGERGDPEQRSVSLRELRDAGVINLHTTNQSSHVSAPSSTTGGSSSSSSTTDTLDFTLFPLQSLITMPDGYRFLVQGATTTDRYGLLGADFFNTFARIDQEVELHFSWSFQGDGYALEARGIAPTFRFAETAEESDAEPSLPADSAIWETIVDGGVLTSRLVSDDETSTTDLYAITRSGMVGDTFNVLTTSLQHNGEEVILNAENIGGEEELFVDKVDDTLRFRTIAGDHAINITADVDSLTIDVDDDELRLFDDTHQGVVPASGGGTTNFLRADGTWATPAGGGGGGGYPQQLAYAGIF